MPAYDNPPHSVNTYTSSVSRDLGGGTTVSYAVADSSVPCSINTASASEVEFYRRKDIVVTHTVAFLASALTTTLVKGMRIVTADRSESYHIRGIRRGRAYGSVPAFVYADCEQAL
jgi:hypothetical protein